MTLEEYRIQLVLSVGEMARKAHIDYNTMRRALEGESISARTARAIAQMLTKETGQDVSVQDIDGLNVNL